MYKWRYLKDKLFVALVFAVSTLALLPLVHMVTVIAYNGLRVIASTGLRFFTDIPQAPLSKEIGGIAPSLVGSFLITMTSLPLTTALALLASILTLEFPRNPISKAVDALSRSLASVPTIVVSMVVYITVVLPMRSFSAFAGAVALTLISLPYAYTSFSSALRSIPRTYREAAYAVGMSRWQNILMVFVPIAKKAIVTSVLITFARAMGETAALLFTVGRYRSSVSLDLFSPTDAIPLLIFDFITSPFKTYHEVAWGASFVLLSMYIVIFVTTKMAVREVRL